MSKLSLKARAHAKLAAGGCILAGVLAGGKTFTLTKVDSVKPLRLVC